MDVPTLDWRWVLRPILTVITVWRQMKKYGETGDIYEKRKKEQHTHNSKKYKNWVIRKRRKNEFKSKRNKMKISFPM